MNLRNVRSLMWKFSVRRCLFNVYEWTFRCQRFGVIVVSVFRQHDNLWRFFFRLYFCFHDRGGEERVVKKCLLVAAIEYTIT